MKPRKHQHAELLISEDGTILAHNITPEIGAILALLEPSNELAQQRAGSAALSSPEPNNCLINEAAN